MQPDRKTLYAVADALEAEAGALMRAARYLRAPNTPPEIVHRNSTIRSLLRTHGQDPEDRPPPIHRDSTSIGPTQPGAVTMVPAAIPQKHSPLDDEKKEEESAPALAAGAARAPDPPRTPAQDAREALVEAARANGVAVGDVVGPGRTRGVVRARRAAVRALRALGLSLADIGGMLGGRDASGIRYLALIDRDEMT